ncbi:MAG: hypothetical protein CMJ48_00015 [Planctomycetaceae bacterium]|nr:hypothetical protein [Planctomycetaceae bacterium]
MNFVGKVFVVLQLLGGFALMGFAGAVFSAQQNWKAHSESVQQALDKKTADLTAMETELEKRKDQATEDRNAFEDKIRGLEAQLTETNRENVDLAKTNEQLNTDLATSEQLAKTTADQEKARRFEALEMRKINVKLHEDLNAKTAAIQKHKDEIFAQKIRLEHYLAKHDKLQSDHALAKKVLAQHAIKFDPRDPTLLVGVTPPTLVVGHIIETRPTKNRNVEYAEISLGSDDDIAKGHTLYIYRTGGKPGEQPKYLGKLHIIDVYTDTAVGTVERVKTGVIRKGDNVTTKL